MAVQDKARVRARLVGLYPTVAGFTTERLDALAAKLKATDDSTDDEIDTEITAINDNGMFTFEQIKKEDDRVRNELSKVKKPTTVEKTKDEPNPDETPSEAILRELKELKEKFALKEEQEQKQSLASKFKADERLKNVPASWIKNNIPQSEEAYEDAVTAVSEEFKQFATENKLETFKNDTPPAATVARRGEKEQVSVEDAGKLAASMLGNR